MVLKYICNYLNSVIIIEVLV